MNRLVNLARRVDDWQDKRRLYLVLLLPFAFLLNPGLPDSVAGFLILVLAGLIAANVAERWVLRFGHYDQALQEGMIEMRDGFALDDFVRPVLTAIAYVGLQAARSAALGWLS